MKISSFLFLIFLSLCLSGCGVEVDPRTVWNNRVGAKELEKGSFTDAQKSFLKALAVDPFIGELHVNLGLTYQALQQGDPAIQSYQSAEKWGQNGEVKFISRFNQGVLHGQNKQVDPALYDYQRSLEIKPDSLEAKTNIELLVQAQSGEGQGEGQNKDDQDKDGKNKDDKDKKKGGEGQDKDNKDQNDPDKKDDKNGQGDQDKEKAPPNPKGDKQYKPREFKGDLSEQDVKKILGELKNQEQKIRGQFYRGDVKEKPRDKDW